MGRLILVLVILILVVIGGGFAWLATRDLPPPTTTVEHEIPNDRFAP